MPGAAALIIMPFYIKGKGPVQVVVAGEERFGKYAGCFSLLSGGHDKKDGYWTNRSGKMSPNLFATMRREAREENGVKEVMDVIGKPRTPDFHRGMTPCWILRPASVRRRDFKPNNEISDMDFIPVDMLLALGDVAAKTSSSTTGLPCCNIDGKPITVSRYLISAVCEARTAKLI